VFATLVLVAGLAAKLAPAAPAPLPDRWLLKLLPDNLPALPDRFYAVTWYHYTHAPNTGNAWEVWADFRKAGKFRPAEAILTLPYLPGSALGGLFGGLTLEQLPTKPGHRTVPLAVHGSLVEFDRKLYTATIRTSKAVPGRYPEREMLHLGSAIEVKDRVWYQAGTTRLRRGKGLSIEEWRIEFREDPRTTAQGKAMVHGHWRGLSELEGESFNAEISFRVGKTYRGGRSVALNWPNGLLPDRPRPHLEIEDCWGGANVIRVDDMHQSSFSPAEKPRPKLSVELMQPPGKKGGK
jgi:hypothetical protein